MSFWGVASTGQKPSHIHQNKDDPWPHQGAENLLTSQMTTQSGRRGDIVHRIVVVVPGDISQAPQTKTHTHTHTHAQNPTIEQKGINPQSVAEDEEGCCGKRFACTWRALALCNTPLALAYGMGYASSEIGLSLANTPNVSHKLSTTIPHGRGVVYLLARYQHRFEKE
ncbi:hypothetical protein ElyMa_000159500 [Elysia marginata]|uniref:Uncharacterized protein n=1 Tax=Elysia marginata TaxID=1093978 RepID=A0AAV4ESU6_9GAST|nr:hypothetical protein ElyMa_000159500 [Elysia marginata]